MSSSAMTSCAPSTASAVWHRSWSRSPSDFSARRSSRLLRRRREPSNRSAPASLPLRHLLLAPGLVFGAQAFVQRERLAQARTGSHLGAREGITQFLL